MSDESSFQERYEVLEGPFDLQCIRNFGGFEGEEALELFEEVLEIFVEDLPERTRGMRAALEAQDLEALAREAHSLKGSSRNTCAMKLGNLCEDLEKVVKGDFNAEAASSQITIIEAECDAITRSVEAFTPAT